MMTMEIPLTVDHYLDITDDGRLEIQTCINVGDDDGVVHKSDLAAALYDLVEIHTFWGRKIDDFEKVELLQAVAHLKQLVESMEMHIDSLEVRTTARGVSCEQI